MALRPEQPFTGVSGPSRFEIPKNSQKRLPWPPGPECPKSLEKSQKSLGKVSFLRLFDSFQDFLDNRGPRPRETFLRLLGGFRARRLLEMAVRVLIMACFPGDFLRENWAAANGGVTNGGSRGVWPPFPEISRNRPFSPFFCIFRPFPEGAKSTWKIQKTEEKGLFPQISSDFLKPPSLKPPLSLVGISAPKKNI